MSTVAPYRRRGGPLAMIGLLLAAWIGGRVMLWESPLALPGGVLSQAIPALAAEGTGQPAHANFPAQAGAVVQPAFGRPAVGAAQARRGAAGTGGGIVANLGSRIGARLDPVAALGHQLLWHAAMGDPLIDPQGAGDGQIRTGFGSPPVTAPFLPGRRSDVRGGATGPNAGKERWSLDAWAFWRAGSNAAPISQGRVPVYGASQVGGVLQYRFAPVAPIDPRLYARAYRAVVRRGESELALGASLRPLPRLPVRVAAELRLTDGAFRTEARPAAYAMTELPPQRLPLGLQLETYAQGGWVGGTGATPFADAQGTLTRELDRLGAATDNALRLSVGAGAWGGAQQGAARVDVGPTMRLDLTLGEVPARLSVDWRERVGGNAGPESGVAATLSTSF